MSSRRSTPRRRTNWVLWAWSALGAALFAGLTLTILSALGTGPTWLDHAGAITIATVYAAALAARSGGRPWVFGLLALAVGGATVFFDHVSVRAGAAVLTAMTSAVLAVMVTVPAQRFRHALREVFVSLTVAAIGAMAVVGFRPVVSLERFDYVSLALSFFLMVLLVFRLGAGLHGLGRRGLVVLVVGTLALSIAMAYAELLRHYGSQALVEDVLDGVAWVRDNLGAVPRPLLMVVGIPALLWGTHMRARRRQGWWVTAFGVAATMTVAGLLVNPDTGWIESGLIIVYSVIPGLLIGFVVVRLDLLLTGPRGRRARREEAAAAIRPEPGRLQALL